LLPKDSQYGRDQADWPIGILTEYVNALNRVQRGAATDVEVGDLTVIEADRNKPRHFWATEPQLFNR
jgi:hypothetical protein